MDGFGTSDVFWLVYNEASNVLGDVGRMTAGTTLDSTAADQDSFLSSATYRNRWRAMAFIAVALTVISLDNTILNVALPSISQQLSASASDLQWIVDSYVLVFASLLLAAGSFSDRIGRKKALQAGLVLFGVGSLACALSTNTLTLILARGFTGIGGAIIMPSTLSIISATFPPNERARAFAIWAAIFGLGVGIGPVTGGLLLKFFPWESVFFVNLPVVVVAIIGGGFFISESKDLHAPKTDYPGVVLSILGMMALLLGIIWAGEYGWGADRVIISFIAAAILVAGFVWWEIRSPNAMLPMELFLNRSFSVANLSLVLMTFSLFGLTFFLSQFFQSVLGYEPLLAGAANLPVAITLVVVGVNSARVAAWLGTKYTVALGATIATGAMLYYTSIFSPTTPYILIAIGQVTMATGLSLMISPSTNSVMQSVPVHRSGVGSAMNDMTRQLGGALGIAVLGSILNGVYRATVLPFVETLPAVVPEAAKEAIMRSIQGAQLAASEIIEQGGEVLRPAAQSIIDASNMGFIDGTKQALTIAAVMMAISAIVALLFLPNVVQRSKV